MALEASIRLARRTEAVSAWTDDDARVLYLALTTDEHREVASVLNRQAAECQRAHMLRTQVRLAKGQLSSDLPVGLHCA